MIWPKNTLESLLFEVATALDFPPIKPIRRLARISIYKESHFNLTRPWRLQNGDLTDWEGTYSYLRDSGLHNCTIFLHR